MLQLGRRGVLRAVGLRCVLRRWSVQEGDGLVDVRSCLGQLLSEGLYELSADDERHGVQHHCSTGTQERARSRPGLPGRQRFTGARLIETAASPTVIYEAPKGVH